MHAIKVLIDYYILDKIIPSEWVPSRLYGGSLVNEEYTRNHWYDFTESQKISHLRELGWGSSDRSNRIRQAFEFLDTVPEAPGGARPTGEHLWEQEALAKNNWDDLKLKEQLRVLNTLHEFYGHDQLHRFVRDVAPEAYPHHGQAPVTSAVEQQSTGPADHNVVADLLHTH